MPLTRKQLTELRSELDGPNRLRAAMRLAGVTQVQLAEAVGITQPHISEIANGNYSRLPYDTVLRLAEYFGCMAEDLFPRREAIA